jgi:hypothetical protein
MPDLRAQVPSKEVHPVFHGLIAFVPDDTGMYTIHMSPGNAPHMPTLAVPLSRVVSGNAFPPDYVLSGPGGEAIGVWRLEGDFSLKQDNIQPPAKTTDYGYVSGTPTPIGMYEEKIRWVPHADDVFGSKDMALDLAEVHKASAVGRFPLGQLLAVFDKEEHWKDPVHKWTINNRPELAVADGVLLKLTLQLNGQPVTFLIDRDGGTKELKIESQSEVRFASYPTAPGSDFAHFIHLYDLRASSTAADPPKRGAIKSTPAPARCAPIVFCCK